MLLPRLLIASTLLLALAFVSSSVATTGAARQTAPEVLHRNHHHTNVTAAGPEYPTAMRITIVNNVAAELTLDASSTHTYNGSFTSAPHATVPSVTSRAYNYVRQLQQPCSIMRAACVHRCVSVREQYHAASTPTPTLPLHAPKVLSASSHACASTPCCVFPHLRA